MFYYSTTTLWFWMGIYLMYECILVFHLSILGIKGWFLKIIGRLAPK